MPKNKKDQELQDSDSDFETTVVVKKKPAKKAKKAKEEEEEEENSDSDFEAPKKTAKNANKQSKKKEKKKSEDKNEYSKEVAAVIAALKDRKVTPSTDPNAMQNLIKIGGHVSVQEGLHLSLDRAKNIGGNCMAIFVKNQRTWTSKPLTDDAIKSFKAACKKHNMPSHLIIPHGSYLVNLGHPEEDKLKKSREAYIDELQRCDQLGLTLYNFHPGSHLGKGEDECIKRISESINYGHEKVKNVIAVIENTAGQGSNVGCTFEQLAKIIEGVKDKSRVGVCLDTCHTFAAGYDLRTTENCKEVFNKFDEIVGFKYLKGMHLNDSRKELGSKLDRHASIGKGFIGLDCFKFIVNDMRFTNIPLILETDGPYDMEIKLLYSLIEQKEQK